MAQSQIEVQSNKWYRFPVDIYWKSDEQLGLESEEFESFYDARVDSIVGWRAEYSKDKGVIGTLIYFTSGDYILAKIKPSTLRKLLNYEPEILSSDFPSE